MCVHCVKLWDFQMGSMLLVTHRFPHSNVHDLAGGLVRFFRQTLSNDHSRLSHKCITVTAVSTCLILNMSAH